MTAPLVREGVATVLPADRSPLLDVGIAVGAATAASGVGLMLMPRLALRLLGAGRTDPAPFLFRVVGMFMLVSGGSMADVCRAPEPSPVGLRWALAAKIGATVMVSGGIRKHWMGKQAVALAAIDAAAAGLLIQVSRRQ